MIRKFLFGPAAVGFALLVVSQVALAQTKVGVVSLQDAVLGTAEIKKADADMQAKYKPKQDEIDQLTKDVADIAAKLKATDLTQQQVDDLNSQGTRKQRDLTRAQEDLQSEVENERDAILTKATDRMVDVVKKLADQKGLDLVVEASNAVYFKPALEITADAIAAYDAAYPVAK